MRFAYADPPYPGLAQRYYGCQEVDHAELLARLARDYPDGWALSTSAKSLPDVLRLVRQPVRVCAWVRGVRPSPSYRAQNAWEPLLVAGGRARRVAVVEYLCDVLLASAAQRPRSHPGALVGMKPPAFAVWLFRLLGAGPRDTLDDLFPGSGAVTRAWDLYLSSLQESDASRAARGDASCATSCATPSSADRSAPESGAPLPASEGERGGAGGRGVP